MMNFNAVNVTMLTLGILLVYCAIKDKTPKEVIQDAFTQGSSTGSGTSANSPSPSNHSGSPGPGLSQHASPKAPHAPVTSN